MNKLKYIPGDLVMIEMESIKPRIVKVSKVDVDNVIYCEDWVDVWFHDEIKPIPLTPEILEKNGWKLLKHHERNSYDDVSWSSYHKPAVTNISLVFYLEEETFFLFLYAQEISETPIRYVHQLQHLLFGLGLNREMEV